MNSIEQHQTDNYSQLHETHFRNIDINSAATRQKFCSNVVNTGKYSVLTFVLLFLREQFRKYANVFFLFVALLQQIPYVSPTGRFTTVVPLSLILMVSAIKEIVEDIKRHKGDKVTNFTKTLVMEGVEWTEKNWQDIRVGDIVKVTNNKAIPADMLILLSSEPLAICYIETSNLDGEANLKLRQGLPVTSTLLEPIGNLQTAKLSIECEHPNRHLEEFSGTLYDNTNQGYPIKPTNLILRGSSLKNTKWVIGAVIFSGKETKVMMNSTKATVKSSSVDKQTNSYILCLFVLLAFLTICSVVANYVWTSHFGDDIWYIQDNKVTLKSVGFMVMTAFILFHTIIPISLQVTLEVVRFVQAQFINWDTKMYDKIHDKPALARTSNLTEELGKIKHVFSDKTGTLTQNVMEFKCCSIAGVCYGTESEEVPATLDARLKAEVNAKNSEVDMFLTILAVCHTVVPETVDLTLDEKMLVYRASSPDERALVEAAKELGYILLERRPDSLTIQVLNKSRSYEILHVLEFTSSRKRMSVIARDPAGRLILMVKGADSVIYERLGENNRYQNTTMIHMDSFAKSGLRTLCVAYCILDEQFYEGWRQMHYDASIAVDNREARLEVVAELIETNLVLLGSTAIEDKLQEEVPETIASLLKARISIWVLTGDKQETAINIGFSCKLLTEFQEQFILDAENMESFDSQLSSAKDQYDLAFLRNSDFALIVSGKTLDFALNDTIRERFLELAMSSVAVLCCRVSPWQKAEVVRLVRRATSSITLAIGDGANDVGMIQAAHIGVGIYGAEGTQAVSASDYAIGQFKFLSRLLFVHGAWNFTRVTKVILYSFYKNVCLFLIQFWFAMVSGYSGQILFDRWTMALYNVAFSSLPPFAIGLFDRSGMEDDCLRYPELYEANQRSNPFTFKVFLNWLLNAVFHSLILFGLPVLAFQFDNVYSTGQTSSLMVVGNSVYTYVVVTVCLKAGLEHTAWTIFSHVAIWGSIIFWFLFLLVYAHVWPTFPVGPEMVGMDVAVFGCPTFWFCLFLVPTFALTRDYAWKVYSTTTGKNVYDIITYLKQTGGDVDRYLNSSFFKKNQTLRTSISPTDLPSQPITDL